MEKRWLFIPIFALLLIGVFSIGVSINNPSTDIQNSINYEGTVCIKVTRADGTIEDNGCAHNTLYNTGAEAIEDYLADGTGGGDAFDWIELCDSDIGCDIPTAGKTEAYTAHAADGLSIAEGTVTDNGNGNWSVFHTFTSTAASQDTNVTRLVNADGDDLAGVAFTLVTLEDGDAISVNWTVSVS